MAYESMIVRRMHREISSQDLLNELRKNRRTALMCLAQTLCRRRKAKSIQEALTVLERDIGIIRRRGKQFRQYLIEKEFLNYPKYAGARHMAAQLPSSLQYFDWFARDIQQMKKEFGNN